MAKAVSEPRHTGWLASLERVLAHLGSLAAVGFVLSAVVHSIYFQINWRVSYFSVATVSDVTLGGLQFAIPIGLISVWLGGNIWISEYLTRNYRTKRFFYTKIVGVVVGALIGVFYLHQHFSAAPVMAGLAGSLRIVAGSEACHRGRVLWVGERNVLARCDGRLTIIRASEDLVMQVIARGSPNDRPDR